MVSLRLSPGIELAGGDADLRVVAPGWQLEFGGLPERAIRAIRELASGRSTEREIHALVPDGAAGLDGSLAHWYSALGELLERGAVTCELSDNSQPLLRWAPMKRLPVSETPPVERDRVLVLSGYACVRRSGAGLVVESPLAPFSVELCDPRVLGLVGRWATPTTLRELEGIELNLSHDILGVAASLLAHAGILRDADQEAECAARCDAWSFSDLLFHGASGREAPRVRRQPPATNPWAGTFHLRDVAPTLSLPEPDLSGRGSEGMTLDQALDNRISIRHHDDANPMTLAALAEFLYRTLRVKSVTPSDGDAVYEHSHRPYPSGGALNPLEVYPVVRMCGGLDEGVYHYDPLHHRLVRRKELDERAGQALNIAAAAMGGGPAPQVLLVIAARPARVFWKYSSVGYAVILREVGVVMQTMYLVATSMGLAPCAVGAGDGLLLPGTNEPTFQADEVSVGAFCLGSQQP